MPKKKNSAVESKIQELENIDLDSIELKTEEEKQPQNVEVIESLPKKEKKNKGKKENSDNYSPEQKEIAKLKSQLMQEKIKNVGKKKASNFVTKKEKRKFSDTSYDSNATTKSILKGAGFMLLAFGFIALLILLIKH